MRGKIYNLLIIFGLATLLIGMLPSRTYAADSDFALLISPSPIVATIKPGQSTNIDINIHNQGSQAETLKIEPRSFSIDQANETVKLNDTLPPAIASWISFSNPTFTVAPGQTFNEQLKLSPPKDSGFSYYFALLISRKNNPAPVKNGRLIKGAVAIFSLVNIDRPGAVRQLKPVKLSTSKHIYGFLPVDINFKLANTGNTIAQPFGNIFIQRGKDDKTPITTLPVNPSQGYILPGTTRTLKNSWADGFQVYRTVNGNDGKQRRELTWDWSKLSHLRFGHYTAKVVAAYNGGHRDVPIESSVSFWVIPWTVLIPLLLIIILILFGLWSVINKIRRFGQRKTASKHK